jgi:flagellar hook-basal body complex protein FliE
MSLPPIGGPLPLASPHQPEALGAPLPRAAETDAIFELGKSFLDLVVQANARSQVAGAMTEQLASGQSDDIHGTMIAGKEAGIQKRLAVNVKDKVIDAFYEIWRMNI